MSEREIQFLTQQLKETQTLLDNLNKSEDRQQKERFDTRRTALELTRIEKDSEKEENKNFAQNKESVG
jgi:hypothetical protein